MTAELDRSVVGKVKVVGERYYSGYNYYYHPLTLDDVEKFCIMARMNGAKSTGKISVTNGISGPDQLSIGVPATFEVLPDVPNRGKNARLNRRLAVVAVSAVAACVLLGVAFMVVLVV